MRRKTIADNKGETLETLFSQMRTKDYSYSVSTDEYGTLVRAAILHTTVSNFEYSNDILIADDTASTNLYDMKLETIITIDAESKSQLYAFGYLSGQDLEAYQLFFQEVRRMAGKAPRVIIFDRCQAQFIAIQQVYPECFIVFCLRHLGKDLEKYFAKDSDVIVGFYDIQRNVHKCEDYIELLKSKLNETQEDNTGIHTIKWMIEYEAHWLPISLIKNGILNDWTTNRVEGFLGCLNKGLDSKDSLFQKLQSIY